ncbi:hypothetical protein [Halegenticoccus tardaugens]|uniref:hypothetical protein n=1 Tax=Halegenticoccus tardaugens TaxID=2071624 RepID=UPI00100AE4C2|nr:hypothetical protein [Halegenticoccus tardaugens]
MNENGSTPVAVAPKPIPLTVPLHERFTDMNQTASTATTLLPDYSRIQKTLTELNRRTADVRARPLPEPAGPDP